MRFLELKIPPVLLGLALGVAMWGSAQSVPFLGFGLPGRQVVAAVLLLAGLVTAGAGVASFRRARTTVNPLSPATASSLVVTGLYRWTRNPMYLGMLLVLLGWAAFLAHALPLVLAAGFIPLMNRLQIGPEERTLTAKFGLEFSEYQTKVRRWL